MILVKPSHVILTKIDGDVILARIENAGRTCYKSEDKATLGSAKKFVEKILRSGHHSVIEHDSISVRIICDRGVTHEIVRHRLCAYSQESTRYCNYKGGVTFVIPPWIECPVGKYNEHSSPSSLQPGPTDLKFPGLIWFKSMLEAESRYIKLLGHDWSPQQARSVLPNSLKTEIVMTANIREWRHILRLRTSEAAHPQMREVMIPILKEFQTKVPILFDEL